MRAPATPAAALLCGLVFLFQPAQMFEANAIFPYFGLAQIAVMGHHVLGSFDATAEVRTEFLRAAPAAPEDRLDLLIRWAFLRSLHFDFCILKLKERGHAEAFLSAAEHGL